MSAANRGTKRNPYDYYQTPTKAIQSLLDVMDLTQVNSFLEPCKGGGNIYNLINAPNKEYCEILENKDYLTTNFNKKFDLIITNPPFTFAQEFLTKSLFESNNVWYLLRINFLGSKKRKEWWQTVRPDYLLALSERPSFTGHGTDATEYAWFGWGDDYCELQKGIHIL